MTTFNEPPNYATHSNFVVLKLFINPENQELRDLYKEHVDKHNTGLKTDPFPNSGFDIFVPNHYIFDKLNSTKMISMDIKSEMVFYEASTNTIQSTAYCMYPRSSISKTPLMLANHTGIIDSGYRGWLIGAFRCLYFTDEVDQYMVEKHTRLLQICHPTLCPVYVQIVDTEEELSVTSRGDGGFGSTGITGL